MIRRAIVTLALLCVPWLAGPPPASARQALPQQPLFQANTDVVILDVAVRHDDDPVMGLTKEDFEVLDNGVAQTLDYVKAETFPVDLTMVVDQSGSLQPTLDRVKSAVGATAELMTPEDTIRVIAFNDKVKEVFDGAPSYAAGAMAKLESEGATSIYDAIAASLIRPKSSGRRALVVTFTDGQDTSATISPTVLTEVAKRADLVLDIFLAYDEANPLGGRNTSEFDDAFHLLRNVAEATGGMMDDMLGDGHVTKALKGALLDFRSRYLMAYTVQGVPRSGWHEITVKIKKPGDFKILARKGYDGK